MWRPKGQEPNKIYLPPTRYGRVSGGDMRFHSRFGNWINAFVQLTMYYVDDKRMYLGLDIYQWTSSKLGMPNENRTGYLSNPCALKDSGGIVNTPCNLPWSSSCTSSYRQSSQISSSLVGAGWIYIYPDNSQHTEIERKQKITWKRYSPRDDKRLHTSSRPSRSVRDLVHPQQRIRVQASWGGRNRM